MLDVLVWTGRFSVGVLICSGRIHNLVNGSCVPGHTIMLLDRIKYFSLSYNTLHLTLHNILMETKEVWSRTGTTCTHMATLGSHGISKFPMCVDCSVFPSGRCMNRGPVSVLIFLSGYPGRMKCPVGTASVMARLTSIFILDVLNRVFLCRFYALYGEFVCYWVCLDGDIIFAVSVYSCLILLMVLVTI